MLLRKIRTPGATRCAVEREASRGGPATICWIKRKMARPIRKNSNRLRDPHRDGPDGRGCRSNIHENFRKSIASPQVGHALYQHRRTPWGQPVDGEKSCTL